jgi:ribonuclease HII
MRRWEASVNSPALIATIKSAPGDELYRLASRYRDDPRKGVQKALRAALQQDRDSQAESQRLDKLYARLDKAKPGAVLVGVDEVGRGALAGPLLVAAVVLPTKPRLAGLDDSKRLTARRRSELAARIKELSLYIGMGFIQPAEIDRFGMAVSLRQAIQQALQALEMPADLVLLDGRPLKVHPKELAIVRGDATEAAIAAASIIAKVARDAIMEACEADFPGFGLAANKGYGSAAHIAALRQHGPTAIHRRSFCAEILGTPEALF